MKQEFEHLYGREIPQSVYDELERLYMADNLPKAEFVTRVKRQHLVESVVLGLLEKAESRISAVRSLAVQQNAVGKKDYESSVGLSIDGLATKTQVITNQALWTHNRHVMGLEKSVTMQRILETLEA